MAKQLPTTTEMIAFKIGARARKFIAEGCPLEGYEMLLAALTESSQSNPTLHTLLQREMQRFERCLDNLEEENPDDEIETSSDGVAKTSTQGETDGR